MVAAVSTTLLHGLYMILPGLCFGTLPERVVTGPTVWLLLVSVPGRNHFEQVGGQCWSGPITPLAWVSGRQALTVLSHLAISLVLSTLHDFPPPLPIA